jgi:hypothetical protein
MCKGEIDGFKLVEHKPREKSNKKATD